MQSPLAIALQGVSFEPLVLALQGFSDAITQVAGGEYYREGSARRKRKQKKPDNIPMDYFESEAILLLLS